VETFSITYGYYQNVIGYIGDWGHYFDMGMIIGRGVFFFCFVLKNLILTPYMLQKNKMPKDLAHLVMEKSEY
jgi:hypothetical protein